MNAPIRPMTVDAYVDWALQQTRGRFELLRGEIVPMSPERTGHARLKHRIAVVLERAIEAAGLGCHMLPDGCVVRIDDHTAFEPDALVYCGGMLSDDTVIIPEPVIVVEVLSPSTASIDAGVKFAGYFKAPSIRHYLIVDGPGREVTHHHRLADGTISSRSMSGGDITLEPPGLVLPLAAIFAAR
jgi:Uma2 family endonuclease